MNGSLVLPAHDVWDGGDGDVCCPHTLVRPLALCTVHGAEAPLPTFSFGLVVWPLREGGGGVGLMSITHD